MTRRRLRLCLSGDGWEVLDSPSAVPGEVGSAVCRRARALTGRRLLRDRRQVAPPCRPFPQRPYIALASDVASSSFIHSSKSMIC